MYRCIQQLKNCDILLTFLRFCFTRLLYESVRAGCSSRCRQSYWLRDPSSRPRGQLKGGAARAGKAIVPASPNGERLER